MAGPRMVTLVLLKDDRSSEPVIPWLVLDGEVNDGLAVAYAREEYQRAAASDDELPEHVVVPEHVGFDVHVLPVLKAP